MDLEQRLKIREREWEAMKYLAKSFPKKYNVKLGENYIKLIELEEFNKKEVYKIPVIEIIQIKVEERQNEFFQ